MIDVTEAAEPKSDQLNADDFLPNKTKVIEITKVHKQESGEQRLHVFFVGDNKKPWKPCKTMIRLLAHIWGPDGSKWVGKKLKLYRDPTVKFGAETRGGIRISHASHIKEKILVRLTKSRGTLGDVIVLPLEESQPAQQQAQPAQQAQTAPTVDPTVKAAGDAAAANGAVPYAAWLATLTPEVKETVRHLHNGWAATAKKVDADRAADGFENNGLREKD